MAPSLIDLLVKLRHPDNPLPGSGVGDPGPRLRGR
jgi:hypothetical protein